MKGRGIRSRPVPGRRVGPTTFASMRKPSWTILIALLVLGGGLLWLLLGRELVQEGRCKLRRRRVGNPSNSQVVSLAFQILEPLPAGPNDLQDLPPGFQQPVSYRMKTGADSLPLVLDLSDGPRLCLDADRDGMFSDERCFSAKSVKWGRQGRRRFGPLRVPSGDRDDSAGAVFQVFEAGGGPLVVYPVYYRYGRLRVGGRAYRIAIVDGDYDGRFGSVVSLPVTSKYRFVGSDLFAIDRNGDGRFEISLYMQSEVGPLGEMVLIEDKYYAVDIAEDGSTLALRPVRPPRGQLAMAPANARLQLRLWSDAADQYLAPAGSDWDLPVGDYQTIFAVLRLQDSSGYEWTFSTLDHLGELGAFEIRSGETTRFQVGPPFLVTADVRKAGTDRVSISPVVRGRAGEEYQAGFRRNNRRPPERTFRIVDEAGNVLVSDKFKYG